MTPIPSPLPAAAGRSTALLQGVSLPAADIAAGLEAASEAVALEAVAEAVAADITEKKRLTWRSIELYQGLRKDSTKSSDWEVAVVCVKEDGGCKPGNTPGRKVSP
jgi:hypothetical protein